MASWPALAADSPLGTVAPLPVLKHSDVVLMYHAGADTYRAYGATVLAWGGTPTPDSLRAGRDARVMMLGSVGMVTEFARFIDEFPEYEQAICLDVEGNRLRVPWLWDHSHKGVPAYWFCTNQPLFRTYLRNRVIETVKAGADGVHVDDHLGTAGNSWLGGCYCDHCMEGFREFLRQNASPAELAAAGVDDLATLDYRALVLKWLAAHPDQKQNLWARPLAHQFAVFESRAAAAFMLELRALAAQTAGRPVPLSANAGMPWLPQVADYQALDFLSCEVDQRAEPRRPYDGVVLAYKVGEALHRPVAATASGQDWAFIKEQNLPGLVRVWIAQAYALGQFFMAPHHQWCYTEKMGTHWYEAKPGDYEWVYRFVRDQAALLDGYEAVAEVGVVLAARAHRIDGTALTKITTALATANIPFRLFIGGDDLLPAALSEADPKTCHRLIVPQREALSPADQQTLDRCAGAVTALSWRGEGALPAGVASPVELQGAPNVWVIPRAKPGDRRAPVVLHLVNRNYDPAADRTVPARGFQLSVDLVFLGRRKVREAIVHQPNQQPVTLPVEVREGRAVMTVPELDLWAVLELR